jgi:hypothetical protein
MSKELKKLYSIQDIIRLYQRDSKLGNDISLLDSESLTTLLRGDDRISVFYMEGNVILYFLESELSFIFEIINHNIKSLLVEERWKAINKDLENKVSALDNLNQFKQKFSL